MTPMTEIEKLKDGVYEKVMSRRFAEVLKEALAEDQVRAEEEDVDAEEAVGYLSSYLQQVIRLCLKDIADRDEENSVDHQLALTNELIASLAKKTEELGGGQEVANAPFLLRSLEHKKNTLLPRRWERPATSLTRSFLFTNSKKDVSMVHELTKEIASSDRIDFLISFIRFSGLQLLLPALRLFTARGGHLRHKVTKTFASVRIQRNFFFYLFCCKGGNEVSVRPLALSDDGWGTWASWCSKDDRGNGRDLSERAGKV